ncbi:MAG TPA: PAS domain S-box protein [Candidatus Binatia bacterium]|nr:PAS domain S-box protein [Candidatus Binatia bacterium]
MRERQPIPDPATAAARLAVLQSLTAKLAAARSAPAVAAVIMNDGLERLGADVGVVALLSADGRTLANVGFEGVSGATRAQWESYPVDSPVPVAEAARTGRMVVVATREERNRRYPVLAAVHGPEHGGPVIALPLRIAQRTGGVLAFCFPDVAAFERHDIEFFQALADQCALALERAALEEDLRREQQALRDREARLNLIHENAGIGAWEWDAATNEVFWSEQYREVYGLDPVEPPSFERGIAVVMEEDREPTLERLRDALANGGSYRAEHRIRHPRKGVRWVAASGKTVRGPDGAIARMVGIVLDITDIKSAEMAVRESASRFRGLMEQAPFSVQVLAPDGRTLQVNAAWAKLWGATLEQLAGYNMLGDAQLEAKGVLPYIRRAFAGETVVIPEIRYDPAQTLPGFAEGDDAARWVSAVAYPRKDESGQLREVVLIHRDVTAERRAGLALRDSEEKFRLLAETLPQLAWMARPDGHIFWYNRRWYDYTGTHPADMEGWGWRAVHDPALLPQVMETWQRSLATGEPFEMVFPLRGADGVFRPFLTRTNPLRDASGAILYWFGTNTDISEMKRMEQALIEADRRKDEFLATLAHELRNPLAPIRNALQILALPGVEAPTQLHAREVMERQVHHLTRLVDDLLDVSRVMRGKIELRREPVALATLVARAIETVQPLIDRQHHALDVRLGSDALHVDGDPERLVQVIANLLTNSAKYTPAGGRIAIEARAERGQIVLGVRDNGIGISPDVLPRVFELFVQGGQNSVRAASGLGVGLTLVKSIVEMHGGSVEAHSDGSGQGTLVSVRLPLVAAPVARISAAGAARLPAGSAVRTLVVDDNRDAADTLGALLRQQGHDVAVAYDGPAALEAARAHPPALVLLDIGMPGMDGYEVARRLRAMPGMERAIIAALTGWGQERDVQRSVQAGFDRHLVKPPKPGLIEQLIVRAQASARPLTVAGSQRRGSS